MDRTALHCTLYCTMYTALCTALHCVALHCAAIHSVHCTVHCRALPIVQSWQMQWPYRWPCSHYIWSGPRLVSSNTTRYSDSTHKVSVGLQNTGFNVMLAKFTSVLFNLITCSEILDTLQKGQKYSAANFLLAVFVEEVTNVFLPFPCHPCCPGPLDHVVIYTALNSTSYHNTELRTGLNHVSIPNGPKNSFCPRQYITLGPYICTVLYPY